MAPAHDRPITIAMLALGGQGGGVLTKWLVDTAEANGYLAQSTYVAGVAQRTGATVYCVELFPRNDAAGRIPVFTPYPVPGDVELVLAGEMAETGRAIQKGFVTPNTTTLIASSHRVYSIAEKEALDDGILDQRPVADIARKAAKHFVCFDMQAAAEQSDSIISAVMLGAIAACDVLPFTREAYEAVIRGSGRAVDANLRGFAAGFEAALTGDAGLPAEEARSADPEPQGANGRALASRIEEVLPAACRTIALHGALRALDYQDRRYAELYIDKVEAMSRREHAVAGDSRDYALTCEVARQLALQMCYEDTIRVAELKTRRDRMQRVRDQLGASEEQPVHVIEYLHPRLEEVCDTLPRRLAAWILGSPRLRRLLEPAFSKGRTLKTSSIGGYLLLRSIAGLRRWRRGSYRYGVQWQHIGTWLAETEILLGSNYDDALAVARAVESVRGYSDTYERGMRRYRDTLEALH